MISTIICGSYHIYLSSRGANISNKKILTRSHQCKCAIFVCACPLYVVTQRRARVSRSYLQHCEPNPEFRESANKFGLIRMYYMGADDATASLLIMPQLHSGSQEEKSKRRSWMRKYNDSESMQSPSSGGWSQTRRRLMQVQRQPH